VGRRLVEAKAKEIQIDEQQEQQEQQQEEHESEPKYSYIVGTELDALLAKMESANESDMQTDELLQDVVWPVQNGHIVDWDAFEALMYVGVLHIIYSKHAKPIDF
jgi:mRNA degradation ribonuclease J1/J2